MIGIGLYLAYHALNGERGWIARQALDQEIAAREVTLEAAEAKLGALENRVRRLRRGSLDPDLLDERARAVLGYGREDEHVIQLDPLTR